MTDQEKLINAAKSIVGEFRLREWFSAGSVASALLTESGQIFTGICVDLPCGIGFCAEHAAIAEMLKSRTTRIVMIVALNEDMKILPPCGRCRELIVQLDSENINTQVIVSESETIAMNDLLPRAWL